MVKAFPLLAVLVAGFTQTAFAQGIEPETKRFTLPPISSLTIEENGALSPAARDSDQTCRSFLLSKRDVTDFLRRAGEVTEHDYFHMLDWSPCYASGTLRFKDGTTGVWGIHRFRGGSIRFSDGRTVYLHCPKCRARAFQPK